ncbi:hypothetical protein QJS04_geneDACA013329 [Acorus gramineus]|uniref:Uncharacterized protein n=1 Tax=Acorus gramineus TaxID=55184 RepID=A0AAV9A8U3_ACOGR|nr:hypothetical protein QJS04_geneDACA013329 [Acorus gramineus]
MDMLSESKLRDLLHENTCSPMRTKTGTGCLLEMSLGIKFLIRMANNDMHLLFRIIFSRFVEAIISYFALLQVKKSLFLYTDYKVDMKPMHFFHSS